MTYNKSYHTGGILEEKIYFKPEEYGKKKENKKKKNHKGIKLVVFLLFLAVIVFIILWLLRGKTTVSGRYPENLKNEFVECIAEDFVYDETSRVSPEKTEMKITAIFYGEKELNSLNLKYTMNFPDNAEAAAAEAVAHVQFAENLGYSRLSYEEFSNKFTRLDNVLVLTLYNSGSKMKEESMYEYFLIKKLSEQNRYPTSLTEVQENYERQGFTCKNSINNK